MKNLIFSVHEKHEVHKLSSIQEAVGLVSDTFQLLRVNENSIRSEVASLPKMLNGPQGNVISETAASIEMLNGLKNPQQVSEFYRYGICNLLSCLTVNGENIRSVVHHKDKPFTVLDHARNFGNAAKEGLKKGTHWAAYFLTNPKSWYPLPERAMIL